MTKLSVVDEAKAVREAMAQMGWQYIGGGPYPLAPVLRFQRGLEKLLISLEARE